MLRKLHKIPGLLAGLLIVVLAITGSVISVVPSLERVGAGGISGPAPDAATLAANILVNIPAAEQIKKLPSGKVIVYYFEGDSPKAVQVDPATGAILSEFSQSPFVRWMTELHRSLFLSNNGKIVTALGAAAMIILSLSGLNLVANRQGGWKNLLGAVKGSGLGKLHVTVGRFAVLAFLLSSTTAIYMTLATFAVISDGLDAAPNFPYDVNGGAPMAVGDLTPLKSLPFQDFRELNFPYAGDPTDAFLLTTASGSGYIDQATGEMLSWLDNSPTRKVYEFIYMLHTGKGLWWLGLILGAAAITIPLMLGTGTIVWWRNRKLMPKIPHNVSAQRADTLILVGSESNSTWGFAKTLHQELTAMGHHVHAGPMNSLKPAYRNAERMFILTATYGDGEAPASAKGFLKRLANINTPDFPVAVLGFGDRQFPQFCQYAQDVSAALAGKGWKPLLETDLIDRQSAQEFLRWGKAVGEAMGQPMELHHVAVKPKTLRLALASRQDYGEAVQVPTSIFRFTYPHTKSRIARLLGKGAPAFNAGDLVGILTPESVMPRYYSLASCSREGQLEICVRKHPNGVCSGYLHNLKPGDEIEAFIKPNPAFRPAKKARSVILVGAGTGVGPLAGFIRDNAKKKPMHLYFGGRDPKSDYLYEDEIASWLQDNRLDTANIAFSRVIERQYVQDRVLADADKLRELIRNGAQILVCGGRDMALGVKQSLETVLANEKLSTAHLKSEGRYVEDVY